MNLKSKKINIILFMSILFFLIVLFIKIINFDSKPIQPFGITILGVVSNSMNPSIRKGNMIIVKKQNDYEEGDVITYIGSDENLVTHRIVRKYENVFITKGDNNNVEDESEVKKEQIIGKVIYVFN